MKIRDDSESGHWMLKAAARSSKNVDRREMISAMYTLASERRNYERAAASIEAAQVLIDHARHNDLGVVLVVMNGVIEDGWLDDYSTTRGKVIIVDPSILHRAIAAEVKVGLSGKIPFTPVPPLNYPGPST